MTPQGYVCNGMTGDVMSRMFDKLSRGRWFLLEKSGYPKTMSERRMKRDKAREFIRNSSRYDSQASLINDYYGLVQQVESIKRRKRNYGEMLINCILMGKVLKY